MGFGTPAGIMFFLLVFFAALTSAIALTESAVSTFEDEFSWSRQKSTLVTGIIVIVLGTPSAMGYGVWANVKILGMQFLDFFDFITNSLMMPVAAIATCYLVTKVITLEAIGREVEKDGMPFKRKMIFNFMISYICPIFLTIILISSIASVFGFISI